MLRELLRKQLPRPAGQDAPERAQLPLLPRLEDEGRLPDLRADEAAEGCVGGGSGPARHHVRPHPVLHESLLQTLYLRSGQTGYIDNAVSLAGGGPHSAYTELYFNLYVYCRKVYLG